MLAPEDDALSEEALKASLPLDLSGSNYLQLATHPSIIQAQINALLMHYVQDPPPAHPQPHFLQQLCQFLQSESVLLAPKLSETLPSLLGLLAQHYDAIYSTVAFNQETLPKPLYLFSPHDLDALITQINQCGPGIIFAPTIHKENGTLLPISELVASAKQTQSMIILDESQTIGVRGPGGAGLCIELGLIDEVTFRVFDLDYSMAGKGSVIAGPQITLDYCQTHASALFDLTALPHDIAGLTATLEVLSTESWRITRIQRNAHYLRQALFTLGYPILTSDSHILCFIQRDQEEVLSLHEYLKGYGIIAQHQQNLLQLRIHAALTVSQLDYMVEVFREYALRKFS